MCVFLCFNIEFCRDSIFKHHCRRVRVHVISLQNMIEKSLFILLLSGEEDASFLFPEEIIILVLCTLNLIKLEDIQVKVQSYLNVDVNSRTLNLSVRYVLKDLENLLIILDLM